MTLNATRPGASWYSAVSLSANGMFLATRQFHKTWYEQAALGWMRSAALILLAFWPITLLLLEPGNVVVAVVASAVALALGTTVLMYISRGDPVSWQILPYAISLKLAGAAAYILIIRTVYRDGADVMGSYWADALRSAETFRVTGQFASAAHNSTDLIVTAAGLLFLVIGPSLTAAIVIFSLVSLAGQYLYYRTFRIVYPDADPVFPAILMFGYPSLLFWTSTVGKDAVILFAIALTVFGFARALHCNQWSGWLYAFFGMSLSYLVRPHIAGATALALLAGFVISKNRMGLRGFILRSLALPLVLAGSVYLIQEAQTLYSAETLSGGLEMMRNLKAGSKVGGSSFGGSLGQRLALAPFLLQRPFLWEAHNLQAVLASLEGILSAVLIWNRRRSLAEALRRIRSDPFVSFACMFVVLLTVLIALPFGNFGLLVRQRTMIVPLVLLLLCVPYHELGVAGYSRDSTRFPQIADDSWRAARPVAAGRAGTIQSVQLPSRPGN